MKKIFKYVFYLLVIVAVLIGLIHDSELINLYAAITALSMGIYELLPSKR